MTTADEIRAKLQANREQRREPARLVSDLDADMFRLVRSGYDKKIPVPELARLAEVTRGRIYQILRGE